MCTCVDNAASYPAISSSAAARPASQVAEQHEGGSQSAVENLRVQQMASAQAVTSGTISLECVQLYSIFADTSSACRCHEALLSRETS